MPFLHDILYKVSIRSVSGSTAMEVNEITIDSRQVKAGSCFVAVRGVNSDGHQYIPVAIEKGASVIVCEEFPANLPEGITFIQAENTAEALGFMAHQFYGNPSEKIKLIGITGTNGKTTIATLLFKLFRSLDFDCGLISTVQNQ